MDKKMWKSLAAVSVVFWSIYKMKAPRKCRALLCISTIVAVLLLVNGYITSVNEHLIGVINGQLILTFLIESV